MPRGGSTYRRGGRQKGTPNKRSVEFLQGLLAHECNPTAAIAALMQDPALGAKEKMDLWTILLPYCYPQFKAIDPDGYLTVDQAAGMIGATIARLKQALGQHVTDASTYMAILEAVTPHANGQGA